MEVTELKFTATPEKGEVSALLMRPENAHHLLVLGHGSGSDMRHRLLSAIAENLAENDVATLRYQFPYMERGGGGLDSREVLRDTVRSAVEFAGQVAGDLPLLAGGHSMSGRMTSMAAAEETLEGVRGIVFFSFPLHPAGKPGTERAAHLSAVTVPMLFLQGTRDDLAHLDLLLPVLAQLGEKATLHVIETGDHGFRVQKRSGKTEDGVMGELARTVSKWAVALGQD